MREEYSFNTKGSIYPTVGAVRKMINKAKNAVAPNNSLLNTIKSYILSKHYVLFQINYIGDEFYEEYGALTTYLSSKVYLSTY